MKHLIAIKVRGYHLDPAEGVGWELRQGQVRTSKTCVLDLEVKVRATFGMQCEVPGVVHLDNDGKLRRSARRELIRHAAHQGDPGFRRHASLR